VGASSALRAFVQADRELPDGHAPIVVIASGPAPDCGTVHISGPADPDDVVLLAIGLSGRARERPGARTKRVR
jgi:hypothetical protein